MTPLFPPRRRPPGAGAMSPAKGFPHGMPGFYRLANPVKTYDWGSTGAIPTLLGRVPDGRPQAEMWIGAHPASPSLATDHLGCCSPLDDLIRSAPGSLLGERVAAGMPPRLPFIFKVLAAERPLSIQVHPDSHHAARRFAEEEKLAQPGSLHHRLYADPWHKPELLYALEPFEALCGFRNAAEAAALLRQLAVPDLAAVISCLDLADEGLGVRRATALLLELRNRGAEQLVRCVVSAARHHRHPAFATVAELAHFHPLDPGVIVSILLNRITLQPGEALYVPPNTVHSYLRGVGVEVMATSDNVLRAGLTTKEVAVSELLSVADFIPSEPRIIAPELDGHGEQLFAPGVQEFRLSVQQISSGEPRQWQDVGPRAVLCLDGRCTFVADNSGLTLAQGESVLIGGGVRRVHVEGDGTLVSALTGGS